MGGDDSQKLLPWRGSYSSPGRKPPAHSKPILYKRFARHDLAAWLLRPGDDDSTFSEDATSYLVNRGPRA